MIRNLKAMGLALVALFALSAVAASAASAEEPTNGKLTADGPFKLLGTDLEEGNALTFPGESPLTCPESHYTGEAVGGGALASGAETITVTPTYTNCKTQSGFPATVTMNGCDFVFHIGETAEPNVDYSLTSDLVCKDTEGNSVGPVIVEIYSGTGEGLKLCTITFGEENNQGLEGGTLEETGTNTAVVSGTFTGITATKEGLCGHKHTTEAEYHVNVALSGYDSDEEEETHVSISH